MHKLYFGALVATIGYFCLSVLSLCSQLIGSQISLFTILFFQNGICLLLTLPKIYKEGWSSLKTERIGLHLSRDIAGVLSYFFLFFALKYVPLVTGTLLLNTGPLWLPFIALAWLRLRISGHLWWGLLIGFLGVLLILKPGGAPFSIGSLSALFSGLLLGFTLIAIRRLATTEPIFRILFYYFLTGVVLSCLPAYFDYIPPTRHDLFFLMSVGVFTFLAQMLITYSFRFGNAATLAPLAYTVVIFSAIFDWLLWDRVPSLITSVGILLVVGGAIVSLHFERQYQKKWAASNTQSGH